MGKIKPFWLRVSLSHNGVQPFESKRAIQAGSFKEAHSALSSRQSAPSQERGMENTKSKLRRGKAQTSSERTALA